MGTDRKMALSTQRGGTSRPVHTTAVRFSTPQSTQFSENCKLVIKILKTYFRTCHSGGTDTFRMCAQSTRCKNDGSHGVLLHRKRTFILPSEQIRPNSTAPPIKPPLAGGPVHALWEHLPPAPAATKLGHPPETVLGVGTMCLCCPRSACNSSTTRCQEITNKSCCFNPHLLH